MRHRFTFVLLGLLLIASSCASRKKAVAPTPSASFEWLSANLSIQAEGNGTSFNDLSGQLRMRTDSVVWASVTTFGMEVMRLKMTTDSVWLLNRMEKTYLAEPLDTLAAQLGMPLSLPLIESLLLGNNQGLPPVENQTVELKTFVMGELSAKIRYSNIKLNETTTFPLKINDKMERISLKKKG